MLKKSLILCGHTGSHNRGADAIVKSTADLLRGCGGEVRLASYRRDADSRYGFEEYDDVCCYASGKTFLKFISLGFRVLHLHGVCEAVRQIPVIKSLKNCDAVSVSVGGDTYCYDMEPYQFREMNRACFKRGIPSVLWGCSVDKNIVENKSRYNDLMRYSLIFPREQETCDALISIGYPKKQIFKMCDPAFTLKPSRVSIPRDVLERGYIAVNASQVVADDNADPDIVFEAYRRLIEHILDNTDLYVAMVPHVYDGESQDVGVHRKICESFKADASKYSRIWMVEKFYNSKELKYIIANSRMLFAARTHASIAGYSSLVPTFVCGYSVKAVGIAKDLFGTTDNYVLMARDIAEGDELVRAFEWLNEHYTEVKSRLTEVMPEYVKQACDAARYLADYSWNN
ncbi:MAG: polysaccharide pyruvyl transferase family protein [Lachnospiraceae bacterium]|nr:polysaccharide pyruvyl transferase family protein [Lachnospiraceae bacterium]